MYSCYPHLHALANIQLWYCLPLGQLHTDFKDLNNGVCHVQKMLKLFHEFDHNKNGMLDDDEIAALNVHLFWDVPRIGSKDISASAALSASLFVAVSVCVIASNSVSVSVCLIALTVFLSA